jgi:hypothetical protein
MFKLLSMVFCWPHSFLLVGCPLLLSMLVLYVGMALCWPKSVVALLFRTLTLLGYVRLLALNPMLCYPCGSGFPCAYG